MQDGDTVVESGGVKVLVDPMSAPYLTGATVDFVEDQRGAGFVVENPNAVTLVRLRPLVLGSE